nr:ngg1-interacting factor 3 [Quercus suber]
MLTAAITKFGGRMSSPVVAAPYSRAVVDAMRKLSVHCLVLLESPLNVQRRQRNSVLLAIDLTRAVADEAIKRKDSIIIAYQSAKTSGAGDQCKMPFNVTVTARHRLTGAKVYCPHTAIDCAQGGLGDWLADIVTGEPARSAAASPLKQSPDDAPASPSRRASYVLQHHPSQLSLLAASFSLGAKKHKRYPITPTKVEGHSQSGGMGRIVRFSSPVPLTEIIDSIGLGLGIPKGFPVAIPQGKTVSEMKISSIGICAGSGGHLFSEAEKHGEDVDLYFTGELSHHEALAAIEKGKCVICLFHSNTERGFLHTVLKPQLDKAVKEEWERIRGEEKRQKGVTRELTECFDDETVEVHVSEVDRDPYGIMRLGTSNRQCRDDWTLDLGPRFDHRLWPQRPNCCYAAVENDHHRHLHRDRPQPSRGGIQGEDCGEFMKSRVSFARPRAKLFRLEDLEVRTFWLELHGSLGLQENSEHALTWEGGPALLFHGVHSLTFEPVEGGKATKFINGETFTGIFGQGAGLPGIKGNVSALYEGYNRDLKKRCEEIAAKL